MCIRDRLKAVMDERPGGNKDERDELRFNHKRIEKPETRQPMDLKAKRERASEQILINMNKKRKIEIPHDPLMPKMTFEREEDTDVMCGYCGLFMSENEHKNIAQAFKAPEEPICCFYVTDSLDLSLIHI